MVLSGSQVFLVVLRGSQWLSLDVFSGSQGFSVVLIGSQLFSVVLSGS